MNKKLNDNHPIQMASDKEKSGFIGYPNYPSNEDVFTKHKIENGIDPDDTSKLKESNGIAKNIIHNENSIYELDVPGSELDDVQEDIGSEDEENNYYSLGGDDHNDLDEDENDLEEDDEA